MRKVATSVDTRRFSTFWWTSTTPKAAPTACVLRNNVCTSPGLAPVATSKSVGSSPSSPSRTQPPANSASCPAPRRVRTTAIAASRAVEGSSR